MRFKGDTPSKKVTRVVVWKRIQELLGARFLKGHHVVLLSAEAGDVPTLLGLGLPPGQIVGVDSDIHAIATVKHRYPNVITEHGDVAAVVKELAAGGYKLQSAYLDFCAPLRDHTVNTIVEVSKYIEPNGVIAIGLKMGREKGDWAQTVAEEKAKVTTGSRAMYLRADLLTLELLKRTMGLRQMVIPTEFFRCSSKSTGDQKSEMLICIAGVHSTAGMPAEPVERAAKRVIKRASYGVINADERTLARLAGILSIRGERADLLLNLDKKSIAPYKAHHARGTYANVRNAVTRHKRED